MKRHVTSLSSSKAKLFDSIWGLLIRLNIVGSRRLRVAEIFHLMNKHGVYKKNE